MIDQDQVTGFDGTDDNSDAWMCLQEPRSELLRGAEESGPVHDHLSHILTSAVGISESEIRTVLNQNLMPTFFSGWLGQILTQNCAADDRTF
jgi:hypothetical protein